MQILIFIKKLKKILCKILPINCPINICKGKSHFPSKIIANVTAGLTWPLQGKENVSAKKTAKKGAI